MLPRYTRAGIAALLGVVLAACAGRAKTVPLEGRTGTLRFREVTPGKVFEGAITLGDSITAQTTDGTCRKDVRAFNRPSEWIIFDCGESRINLNRLNPERRSSFAIRVTTRTARRVCDEYGARGCVRYSTEYVENLAWRSYPLRFIEP